ncbi:MAG: GNAT family N-acetyltransferase [Actinobacteria bacterium]|nr:GNAT family N-acetyltransferase [Actinomycetota bacterium]
MPGLPDPDGQSEQPSDVLAALRAGGSVFTAASGGRLVAALRVHPAAGCWRISRISVLPGERGRGITRLLLDVVAGHARRNRVDWLELDAVVERCLPPLYARLGFAVVSNWPSPDKPLSEVTMRRPSAGPWRPVPPGWSAARLSEHRTVVAWYLNPPTGSDHSAGPTLVRVSRRASGDPLADALAAGAELFGHPMPIGGPALAGIDLSPQPANSADRVEVFPGRGRTEPEHLMPRVRHADTLALWRPAPGREPLLADLGGAAR